MTYALGCLGLALGCVLGALRCLADKLLPSALIYTLLASALLALAIREAATAVL